MPFTRKKVEVFGAADIPKIYRDIIESYHHQSDLLAELLQNAVDSVRIAEPANPLVEVTFDAGKKELSVCDNGLGMSPEELEDLAIGRTKKEGGQFSSLGGEKGLGSAFIFGGSDRFSIETTKDGQFTIAECIGAYDAIQKNQEPEFFILEEKREERTPNSTKITVSGKLFFMDFENRDDIEQILRTYTAVGYTLPLLGQKGLEIVVTLSWIDASGEKSTKKIRNVWRHPAADSPDKLVEYADVENIEDGSGLLLKLFDERDQALGIFGESREFQELGLPTGIFLSVKGYPTAVEIPPPKTGVAGYWARNVQILINFDRARLDAGRKSVQPTDKAHIREIAKNVFNKLVKHQKKFIRQTEAEVEKAVLQKLQDEAKELPSLGIKGVPYLKVPRYENAVLAIFHELIGARLLEGYYPLGTSGDTRYDEIVHYKIPIESLGENFRQKYLEARRNVKEKDKFFTQTITVEYKLNAIDIMRDVKKDLRHINLLVAFDCDTSKLRDQWKWTPLDPAEVVFIGARYQLKNPTNDSCYVLLLKDFCNAE